MYAWLIAHNFGIIIIAAPLALLTWALMTIEEKIVKILRKKA